MIMQCSLEPETHTQGFQLHEEPHAGCTMKLRVKYLILHSGAYIARLSEQDMKCLTPEIPVLNSLTRQSQKPISFQI